MLKKFNKYQNCYNSFDTLTRLAIICLIIVISGFFGFLYEFIFYFFNDGMKYFSWHGGNFLPWINIYAIGALMVYFFTYKYKDKPIKVFYISFLICGLLEYFSGLLIYIIGDGLRYWNYNTEILNFGNIGGFICLRSLLFFGISSLLLIYVIVPFCFYLAKTMNKKKFITISFLLCSIVLLDEFYNLLITRIFNLPKAKIIYRKLKLPFIKFK